MMIKNVSRVMAATLLTGGVVLIAPTIARAQSGSTILPAKEGPAIVVGCFLKETVKDKQEVHPDEGVDGPGDKYDGGVV